MNYEKSHPQEESGNTEAEARELAKKVAIEFALLAALQEQWKEGYTEPISTGMPAQPSSTDDPPESAS